MHGMPQQMKHTDKAGTNIQMILPNSQTTKPHREGFVVMICQNPINHMMTRPMVMEAKKTSAAILNICKAVHSHEPVSSNPAAPCSNASHPVSLIACDSIGRSQGYPPVSAPSPTQIARTGMRTQTTKNKPSAANVMGSQWPLQNFCRGLFSQILACVPVMAFLANCRWPDCLRSMCKYQAEIAIRICLAVTRGSEPPKASARCRT
mmetsp:Transcript_53899/g.163749  ORF Transcript_53899/g.163749 Transcript_53899/m.163749 type:complete len:206 (-) Transcript_53899:1195-1812(-)